MGNDHITQHMHCGLTPLPFRDIAPYGRDIAYAETVRRHVAIYIL